MIKENYLNLYLCVNAILTFFNFIMIWKLLYIIQNIFRNRRKQNYEKNNQNPDEN